MHEPVNRLVVVFVQMGQNSGSDKFYILRWEKLRDILVQEYTAIWKNIIGKDLKIRNHFMQQY